VQLAEGSVEAGGLHFRYLASGPESGPLYLLLHGFPEGAESWRPQLEALGEAGFRAVAPDLRGYGGTDAPDGVDEYRMGRLTGDVAALADALRAERFHLAGHDWGAAIGWAFAIAQPDRLLTYGALSVPHPVPLLRAMRDDDDQRERSRYIGYFRDGQRAESGLMREGMKPLRAIYDGKLPGELVERYARGFERPGRLTAALNYYRAGRYDGEVPAGDLSVGVPTVLIWGDRDVALGRKAVDETAQYVRAAYRLVVLEGAGHWLQFERPAEVSGQLVKQASLT
jgi:pimeloyl-ACP methyl ester carboxylesterase